MVNTFKDIITVNQNADFKMIDRQIPVHLETIYIHLLIILHLLLVEVCLLFLI